MSKYEPLWEFIKDNNKDNYELSFDNKKDILNFELDHSFLRYKKELEKYGYRVSKIKLKEKIVIFNKI